VYLDYKKRPDEKEPRYLIKSRRISYNKIIVEREIDGKKAKTRTSLVSPK
jgi:hypothetical protein